MKTGKQLLATLLVLSLQSHAFANGQLTAQKLVGDKNIDQAMATAMPKV
jgi:hypothetical protein